MTTRLQKYLTYLFVVLLTTNFVVQPTFAQTNCVTLPDSPSGFMGEYYTPNIESLSSKSGNFSPSSGNPWFQSGFLQFTKLDQKINLGTSFTWPAFLNIDKKTAPLLAVHWRAITTVIDSNTFNFTLNSKGNAWLFVNNTPVVTMKEGVLPSSRAVQVGLMKGKHTIDVYFGSTKAADQVISLIVDAKLSLVPPTGVCPSIDAAGNGTWMPGPLPPVVIPTTVPSIPQSQPYSRPLALRKARNSPRIYAIFADGHKWHISGPTAFENYGYAYGKVQTVAPSAIARLLDARIVRTRSEPKVYAILANERGQLQRILMPSESALLGYPITAWGPVRVVDDLDLAGIPIANLVKARGDSAVYLLQDNERHPFLNWQVFVDLAYDAQEIVTLPPEHVNAFSLGDPLG